VDDLSKLWQALADRFGRHDLTEKYRTKLIARVRKPNESLSSLYADVKRLSALGYPGPTSSAKEAIMRDCFIEALDPDLALKLREKEVTGQTAAVGREKQTESHRSDEGRDRYSRNVVVTGSRDAVTVQSVS